MENAEELSRGHVVLSRAAVSFSPTPTICSTCPVLFSVGECSKNCAVCWAHRSCAPVSANSASSSMIFNESTPSKTDSTLCPPCNAAALQTGPKGVYQDHELPKGKIGRMQPLRGPDAQRGGDTWHHVRSQLAVTTAVMALAEQRQRIASTVIFKFRYNEIPARPRRRQLAMELLPLL